MYKLENNVAWTTALKNAFKHNMTRASIFYLNDNNEQVELNENNNLVSLTLTDEKYITDMGFVGSACAKKLEVTIQDSNNSINLENKELTLKIGAVYNNSTYYINYGNFIVDEPPQIDETNGKMKIVAYDYMIKFNQPYIDRSNYPVTLLALLQDVCSQAGVTLETTDFSNKNFIVTDNQFQGATLREVLMNIAKCAFSWARIGQDNKLYLDFSQTAEATETITIDEYKLNAFKKSKGYYGPVNRVVYADSDIEGQEEKVQDAQSIQQNGLKELVIYDNLFAYTPEKRQALIQAGTSLFGLTYMPVSKLDLIGFIYLDCNDIINIETLDEQAYTTRVFNHTINYSGTTNDTIVSEGTSTNQETYKNTASNVFQSQQTRIIVDKANKTINSVVQQIGDRSTKTTTITQDIDGIESKVEDIEDLTVTITGNREITLEDCMEGYLLEMHIYGNNTVFDYLYPEDDLYPADNLYPRGDSRILVTDEENNTQRYELRITEVLRANSEVYDEYVLKDGYAQIIRRVNADGTTKVLEEIENLGRYTIYIPKGTNTLKIENYYADFSARYIPKNTYTDQFASEIEMNSKIEQTAEEINMEVSRKVGEDEIISKINQSAEQISISANKININGVVSANGNFEIDTDGNVSLAGNIYMTGTNTKIVGGDGLVTNLQYFVSGNVGLGWDGSSKREGIACLVNIPSDFTILSAKLTVEHSTLTSYEYDQGGTTTHYGNSKNITCSKQSSMSYERTGANVDITVPVIPSSQGTLVANLGNFSGSQSKSVDITDKLSSGLQYLILADYVDSASSWQQSYELTGYMTMFVDVKGYMRLS